MKVSWISILPIIFIILFTVVKRMRNQNIWQKNIAEFKQSAQTEYILVDVRTKGEFNSGTVENAINIPLDELPNNISKFDKSKKIYLFCASGTRSGIAEDILKKHGFDVYNLGEYSSL